MGAGGVALRLLATLVYAINFCCAGIILGIYSYFLSVLANRNIPITRDQKAIEGLSGVAVLFTIFAICLTCFLGGIRFFAILAVILDVAFAAAFIALAILLRHGASSCNANYLYTPIGNGEPNQKGGYANGFGFGEGQTVTYSVTNRTACRLNTAAFAVAIIGIFFFLIAAALQIAVTRHHQKEKKYGPSPANNYTSGSGKRKFWQRKPKHNGLGFSDAEVGTAPAATGLAAPAAAPVAANRVSHETGYTGTDSTATKYEHGGYHTAPTGTGVSNPYSYTNAAPINPNLPSSTNY